MPSTALRIVIDRLKERLDTLTGINIFIDRAEVDSYDPSEFDAANLRFPRTEPTQPDGQHSTLHRGSVFIDLLTRNSALAVADQTNQANAALIHAKIMEDWTLGGRLQDLTFAELGGTEMDGADVGRALLQYDVQYWTPNHDLSTIIGAGGVLFTD